MAEGASALQPQLDFFKYEFAKLAVKAHVTGHQ